MKEMCKKLFTACCIFEKSVSPSLWTLCNATPDHASQTLLNYGLGLGCNSIEGREQKHQKIAKYAENTTFQNRWPQIFRHEYIQLIFLRENGYDTIKYLKRESSYIPNRNEKSCPKCLLDMELDSICLLCDTSYMKNIEKKLNF